MGTDPTRYGPHTAAIVAALKSVSTIDAALACHLYEQITQTHLAGDESDWFHLLNEHHPSEVLPEAAADSLTLAIRSHASAAADNANTALQPPTPGNSVGWVIAEFLAGKVAGILAADSGDPDAATIAEALAWPWDYLTGALNPQAAARFLPDALDHQVHSPCDQALAAAAHIQSQLSQMPLSALSDLRGQWEAVEPAVRRAVHAATGLAAMSELLEPHPDTGWTAWGGITFCADDWPAGLGASERRLLTTVATNALIGTVARRDLADIGDSHVDFYDVLTGPYRAVVGRLHRDDPVLADCRTLGR